VKPAVLSPRARRDLIEAVRWIAKDNPAAARALRHSVARAAQLLGQFPSIGRLREDIADPPVRFHVLRGFPYLLVYDADASPPRILRILHGARDLPEVLGPSP
jgi:toxin ParE1/3/4